MVKGSRQKQWLKDGIERLTATAFFRAQFSKIELENDARIALPTGLHWRKVIRVVVTFAIIFCLFWFLFVRIGNYFNWQKGLVDNKLLYNLTRSGVTWDVYYGKSPMCGHIECLLLPETPSDKFQKKMVLPAREFPLKDYKPGDIVYLRTKITLPENLRKLKEPISFQTIYVWAKSYTFYANGIPLEEGPAELLDITLPREVVERDKPINIALRIDPGDLPYQGLANRADIFIGPKSILGKTIFDAQEFKTTYFLWFILPKLTFCLSFGFLFLAVSRHRELFSFILFGFLSTADAFLQSGYAAEMLPSVLDWQLVGLLVRCLAMIMFVRFIHDFYRRKSPFLKRYQAAANIFVVCFAVLALTVMGNEAASGAALVLSCALRLFSVLYALYISFMVYLYLHSTGHSRFRERVALFLTGVFAIAVLPVFIDSAMTILELCGLTSEWGGLSLSWIFDLVFFMVLSGITAMEFGLTVNAKELSEARIETLEGRLALAKTVQQLLLPKSLEGVTGDYRYSFYYEPAEQMSGDWLNIWHDEETGGFHLLFGDVVGKGPQAALAVSAIASMMSDAKVRNLSMEECILGINRHLRLLFKGHINSTLSAITLNTDRTADLYTCGTIGWFVLKEGTAAFMPLRGTPLGMNEHPIIGHQRIDFSPTTTVFSFSDGCLEGSRATRLLLKALREPGAAGTWDMETLIKTIVQIGSDFVQRDDKTALVVTGEAASEVPNAETRASG